MLGFWHNVMMCRQMWHVIPLAIYVVDGQFVLYNHGNAGRNWLNHDM